MTVSVKLQLHHEKLALSWIWWQTKWSPPLLQVRKQGWLVNKTRAMVLAP